MSGDWWVLGSVSLLHQFGEEIYLVNHLLLNLLQVCKLPFQGLGISGFMPFFGFFDWFPFWVLLCCLVFKYSFLFFLSVSSLPLLRKHQGSPFCPSLFFSLLRTSLKFCEVHWHEAFSYKPQTFLHRESMHLLFCVCPSGVKWSRELNPF